MISFLQSPNDTLALWGTVGALVMQNAEPKRKTANPCAPDQLRLLPKKCENYLFLLLCQKIGLMIGLMITYWNTKSPFSPPIPLFLVVLGGGGGVVVDGGGRWG